MTTCKVNNPFWLQAFFESCDFKARRDPLLNGGHGGVRPLPSCCGCFVSGGSGNFSPPTSRHSSSRIATPLVKDVHFDLEGVSDRVRQSMNELERGGCTNIEGKRCFRYVMTPYRRF